MPTNRRALLRWGTALGVLAPLGACATLTPSQLQSDVKLIATGLSGIVAALAALPGSPVPKATLASIANEISIIQDNALAIATAFSPNNKLVTMLVDAVQALTPLVAPFFPAAPAIAAVVQAALSLAQVVLQEAGIVGALAPTGRLMPPALARQILAKGA